jgi:signal transduction histidine kinase
LVPEGGSSSGRVARSLVAIADLTKSAQGEIRSLILELHRDPVHDGLVAALARHATGLRTSDGMVIAVDGPELRLTLSEPVESQLFAIGQEALANVQKHAGASTAHARVEAQHDQVVLEIRDNGRGFTPAAEPSGHFGLDSMRSRAAEIGGSIAITSAPGSGTLVRVCVPAGPDSI